jgi:hypothetical protein
MAAQSSDTISSATSVESVIHHHSYYDMREYNRRDVNNQWKSQHLKHDRASQADELALMTNALWYISMLSNKALFLNKCFSYPNPRCRVIHFIDWLLISKLGLISYPRKLIILELQTLQWAANNIRYLLWTFQDPYYHQFTTEIPTSLYRTNIKHSKLIRELLKIICNYVNKIH